MSDDAVAQQAQLSVAKAVHDELQQAAVRMEKLATQGAKRRRKSADNRRIQEEIERLEGP